MNNDSFIRATGPLFRIMEPDPQASALNQNILSLPLLSKNVLRWRRPHLWFKIYESNYEYLFGLARFYLKSRVLLGHSYRMLQAIVDSKSRPMDLCMMLQAIFACRSVHLCMMLQERQACVFTYTQPDIEPESRPKNGSMAQKICQKENQMV